MNSSTTVIKDVNQNQQKSEQDPEQDSQWTRKEMLLHGGTSWFYLVLMYYIFQDSWSIIVDSNETLFFIPKLWIYLGSILMGTGGIGMAIGLFKRPAWRGWLWAAILAIAASGQILYTYLYYEAHIRGLVSFPELVDNFSFALFICIGYFRAVFDVLLQNSTEIRFHCPRPFCSRRG